MDYFETQDFKAHMLYESDYVLLLKLYTNEKVCATLGGIRTAEWVEDYVKKNIRHWNEYRYGCWIFHDIKSGAFAGRGVIRHVEIDGKDEIEIGYALMPEYWGKGLATQMAKELVRIALEVFGIHELVSFALANNAASERVMQKAGFRFDKLIVYSNLPHVLYRLTNKVNSY